MNASGSLPSTLPGGERIAAAIRWIRGQKVLLDSDLAELYGVSTKVLNRAVKRNAARFPSDFMFRLSAPDWADLRSRIVTSNGGGAVPDDSRYHSGTSSGGHGGRRHLPYAFTEQGVAMLSSVLRSEQAVAVNIQIMRTFVKMRHVLEAHAELARRLDELERRNDHRFELVFEAIRQLLEEEESGDGAATIGFDLGRGRSGACHRPQRIPHASARPIASPRAR